MNRVTTQDIYESAYYLTLGADVENVELLKENNRFVCKFTLSGDDLLTAQNNYFNAKALVNLWDFRRCYNRISSLIGTARKEVRGGAQ
jgi:hypothetical protein